MTAPDGPRVPAVAPAPSLPGLLVLAIAWRGRIAAFGSNPGPGAGAVWAPLIARVTGGTSPAEEALGAMERAGLSLDAGTALSVVPLSAPHTATTAPFLPLLVRVAPTARLTLAEGIVLRLVKPATLSRYANAPLLTAMAREVVERRLLTVQGEGSARLHPS